MKLTQKIEKYLYIRDIDKKIQLTKRLREQVILNPEQYTCILALRINRKYGEWYRDSIVKYGKKHGLGQYAPFHHFARKHFNIYGKIPDSLLQGLREAYLYKVIKDLEYEKTTITNI